MASNRDQNVHNTQVLSELKVGNLFPIILAVFYCFWEMSKFPIQSLLMASILQVLRYKIGLPVVHILRKYIGCFYTRDRLSVLVNLVKLI